MTFSEEKIDLYRPRHQPQPRPLSALVVFLPVLTRHEYKTLLSYWKSDNLIMPNP
jgi:hypothetical protein